jgi:hypothetical protein
MKMRFQSGSCKQAFVYMMIMIYIVIGFQKHCQYLKVTIMPISHLFSKTLAVS